jgi:hypothetical protein
MPSDEHNQAASCGPSPSNMSFQVAFKCLFGADDLGEFISGGFSSILVLTVETVPIRQRPVNQGPMIDMRDGTGYRWKLQTLYVKSNSPTVSSVSSNIKRDARRGQPVIKRATGTIRVVKSID